MKKIEKILKNKNYRIFYLYEYCDWGARHYNYSKIVKYKALPGSIIVKLTYFPYGHGSQWSTRETLVFVPQNTPIPTAQMKYFTQDWALLEKRPEPKVSKTEIILEEISTTKAMEIYESYLVYPEEKISIEVEKVK